MKPETLKAIKADISKFYKLYKHLIVNWNSNLSHGHQATYPETVLISVLLQNMQFDGTGTFGYSHEKECQKIMNIKSLIIKINEYHDKCYMTHYAANEVEFIISGHYMSEIY